MPWRTFAKTLKKPNSLADKGCSGRADAVALLHGAHCIAGSLAANGVSDDLVGYPRWQSFRRSRSGVSYNPGYGSRIDRSASRG